MKLAFAVSEKKLNIFAAIAGLALLSQDGILQLPTSLWTSGRKSDLKIQINRLSGHQKRMT
jgi:hypothetical protein